MNIFHIETETYYYEHLLDSSCNNELIRSFYIEKESGKGLENYLKNLSIEDEKIKASRTYLVKDKFTKEIVAFFTLKAGLFTVKVD